MCCLNVLNGMVTGRLTDFNIVAGSFVMEIKRHPIYALCSTKVAIRIYFFFFFVLIKRRQQYVICSDES